jgi:endonuclease/exonuclease/phosphatase family metal-dependent hydrolase
MTFIRWLLLVATVFCFVSCDRSSTPDWEKAGVPSGGGETTRPPVDATASADEAATPERALSSKGGLRFIAYNVHNWLISERSVNGKSMGKKSKPADEKSAVISILSKHSPDVIGLCEIGSAEDLAEIQLLLKAAGVDLPHSHYTGGSDPVRHLGLLSRFPIVGTERPHESEYKLQGKTFALNRGILDATVDVRGTSYRFVGAHLKSKLEVEGVDQEEMRQAEARLLRRHVDRILDRNPQERLVVYGDFNDTRASDSLKTITGNYGQSDYLTPLPAKDRTGTTWTHFWDLHDVYARIDFVTISRALKAHTDFQAVRILDDTEWDLASDHRPVLAVFR